jgi:hypothetical protein
MLGFFLASERAIDQSCAKTRIVDERVCGTRGAVTPQLENVARTRKDCIGDRCLLIDADSGGRSGARSSLNTPAAIARRSGVAVSAITGVNVQNIYSLLSFGQGE